MRKRAARNSRLLIAFLIAIIAVLGASQIFAQSSSGSIEFPRQNETVSGTVQVVGSINVPGTWQLSVCKVGGEALDCHYYESRGGTISSGTIAQVDTTALPDGEYAFAVIITKADNNIEYVTVSPVTVSNWTNWPNPPEYAAMPSGPAAGVYYSEAGTSDAKAACGLQFLASESSCNFSTETAGFATIPPLYAQVFSGDVIEVQADDGTDLVLLTNKKNNQVVVVIVNSSLDPLEISVILPYGGFRGVFALDEMMGYQRWEAEQIANLRDLGIWNFLQNARVDGTNYTVSVWDGNWYQEAGFYSERGGYVPFPEATETPTDLAPSAPTPTPTVAG